MQHAARVAICTCLALGAHAVLFDRVFPLFQAAQTGYEHQAAGGGGGGGGGGPLPAFLTALEPHILADRLHTLAPEVVQALVEHFTAAPGGRAQPGAPQPPQAAAGEEGAARVERCVLHLDVLSLDLNQVGGPSYGLLLLLYCCRTCAAWVAMMRGLMCACCVGDVGPRLLTSTNHFLGKGKGAQQAGCDCHAALLPRAPC